MSIMYSNYSYTVLCLLVYSVPKNWYGCKYFFQLHVWSFATYCCACHAYLFLCLTLKSFDVVHFSELKL